MRCLKKQRNLCYLAKRLKGRRSDYGTAGLCILSLSGRGHGVGWHGVFLAYAELLAGLLALEDRGECAVWRGR